MPSQGPMPSQGIGRSGPIWVDDVVLACSNHAFDVALAHRSSEVRLEHLLHALTRIDMAADVLEMPWEKVVVNWGDTSQGLPWTCLSVGSQTTHAMTRANHAGVHAVYQDGANAELARRAVEILVENARTELGTS